MFLRGKPYPKIPFLLSRKPHLCSFVFKIDIFMFLQPHAGSEQGINFYGKCDGMCIFQHKNLTRVSSKGNSHPKIPFLMSEKSVEHCIVLKIAFQCPFSTLREGGVGCMHMHTGSSFETPKPVLNVFCFLSESHTSSANHT